MGIPHRVQPARGLSEAEDRPRLLIDTVRTLVFTSLLDTSSYSFRDELDPVSEAQVRLVGFGITLRLSRERRAPELHESVAGTLALMVPKTHRENESLDRFTNRPLSVGRSRARVGGAVGPESLKT